MSNSVVSPTTTTHTWPFDYTDYQDLQRLITEKYSSSWPEIAQYMTDAAYDVDNVEDLCRFANVEREYFKDGKVCCFKIPTNVQNATTGVSSNASKITRASVQGALNTGTSQAGKVTSSVLRGAGTKVTTALGKASIPMVAASIGITLGKAISPTLYNLNPGFWNDIGLYADNFNPDKWASMIIGDNELGQDVFNLIFGIDPQTGESQAYMDADSAAYMAYMMWLNDVWATGQTSAVMDDPNYDYGAATPPIVCCRPEEFQRWWSNGTTCNTCEITSSTSDCWLIPYRYGRTSTAFVVSTGSFRGRWVQSNGPYYTNFNARQTTYQGYTFYWAQLGSLQDASIIIPEPNPMSDYTAIGMLAIPVLYGTITQSTPIEGLSNQSGATLPDFTGLGENDILPYLQTTYPDMFNNAIGYDVLQPDGTVDHHTYIPITLPEGSGWADSQPVSGTQTQANPAINPETSPIPIVELLTNLLQEPQPITEENPYGDPVPPSNPTIDGDGSSTTSIVPTGSASSLWAIYHPTQAQVDSFGAWLWSSAFIDQILKIFNNPMEAIIGLHKVYATPIDAGTRNIKVGYLDTQISSAYIASQYVYIDCGSVDLLEQFGNVFDYSPYTKIQLYLPFIGIVPLDVADIMRSTISIEYGVDVLTGACLASVSVSRDENESVLYQYSGNCSVQYPISSGSYMGIVSGIISIAGGIAATVATGGGAAPVAIGAAGAALNMHTDVQHSGSFSGNAGAMGSKVPYLIISRPQTKVANNSDSIFGYPTNHYTTISECSGYVKANSTRIINCNATDEELTKINDLLLSGIII